MGECVLCGRSVDDDRRFVLVAGGREHEHCSESCVRENLRLRRIAHARARRRWVAALSLMLALPIAGKILWKRYRLPQAEVISSAPPEPLPEPPPPQPVPFGPAWPPTDADWSFAFRAARWVYPLPGPVRRIPSVEHRSCGPPAIRIGAATCREAGRCGVALGGELWGEHVYAAQDGVVDRVQGISGEEHGGQFVRLSHMGGMVFTHYLHLAGIPRTLVRGVHVKAGDVIGLLGDTGMKEEPRHLHFALSVWPSSKLTEVYWDPTPFMETWPLQVPTRGTVAGLVPAQSTSLAAHRRHMR